MSEIIEEYQPEECSHIRIQRQIVPEKYFNRQFEAEVAVCRDCNARLWTDDTRQKFYDWIVDLKQHRRDTFRVQISLSLATKQQIKEFLVRFPGVSTAGLIRTMTAVYLVSLARIADFQALTKKLDERASLQSLKLGKKAKTKIQFSPSALLDIHGWSAMLKVTTNEIIEESILKLLAFQNETDPELKEQWEKNLLPQIELILRSV